MCWSAACVWEDTACSSPPRVGGAVWKVKAVEFHMLTQERIQIFALLPAFPHSLALICVHPFPGSSACVPSPSGCTFTCSLHQAAGTQHSPAHRNPFYDSQVTAAGLTAVFRALCFIQVHLLCLLNIFSVFFCFFSSSQLQDFMELQRKDKLMSPKGKITFYETCPSAPSWGAGCWLPSPRTGGRESCCP